MMINCPKCNVLQHKDQYCASCGVNMESWAPPKIPTWKKLISNWMIQLAILFTLVFFVVIQDNFSKKESKPQIQSAYEQPPKQRGRVAEPESSQAVAAQSFSEPQLSKKRKVISKIRKTPQKKLSEQLLNKSKQLQKNVNAKIYLASSSQVEKMTKNARRIDNGVAIVGTRNFKNRFRSVKKQWKSIDSIRKSFQFNKSKLLFSGTRSPDGQNIGFYFQVTVLENPGSSNITCELQIWNELKINGEPAEHLVYEMSIPRGSLVIASQFAPRGLNFTDDERALFDSSSSLQALNSESFIEDEKDMVLVLQLN